MGGTTTSDDADPRDAAESQVASRFWHLREDDKRLLFITVVGGLAANVGLVLIVGLGVLEAHLIHHYEHAALIVILVQLGVMALSAASGIVANRTATQEPAAVPDWYAEWLAAHPTEFVTPEPAKISRADVVWVRIFAGFGALQAAVLILGLVGYAAGIK